MMTRIKISEETRLDLLYLKKTYKMGTYDKVLRAIFEEMKNERK